MTRKPEHVDRKRSEIDLGILKLQVTTLFNPAISQPTDRAGRPVADHVQDDCVLWLVVVVRRPQFDFLVWLTHQ